MESTTLILYILVAEDYSDASSLIQISYPNVYKLDCMNSLAHWFEMVIFIISSGTSGNTNLEFVTRPDAPVSKMFYTWLAKLSLSILSHCQHSNHLYTQYHFSLLSSDWPWHYLMTATDRCQLDNGGCEQQCWANTWDDVRCSCRVGYKLADDKKACIGKEECKCSLSISIPNMCMESLYPFRKLTS